MENSFRSRRKRGARSQLGVESLETRHLLATVTLAPVQDATLYQVADGVTANGAGTGMFTGTTNIGSVRRGLVLFDFDAIPPTSIIENVTLQLTTDRTDVVTEPQTVSIHAVSSSWGEGVSNAGPIQERGTVPAVGDTTWLHRTFDTQSWNSPGGDFDVSPIASTVVAGAGQQYIWSNQDMIDLVQEWVDLPDENYGWLIRGNESTSLTHKRFHTRESGANRPALVVEFVPADIVAVSINDVTRAEGDQGPSFFEFDVALSKASEVPVTVEYETRSGSASEGDDFTGTSGQLNFNPGESLTQSVTVVAQGDLVNEDDEDFFVAITSITGAEVQGLPEAKGIIENDDPLPMLNIDGLSVDEGDGGLTSVELTVTLSEESSRQITVFYRSVDDTATEENLDYVPVFGQAVFAPGDTERTIGVQIQGDTDDEADEDFLIELVNPNEYAVIGQQPARITIQNDDSAVEFPWHNQDFPQDVTGDGLVVPLDALRVINLLNSLGAGLLAPPEDGTEPPPFIDVKPDNFLAPLDALLVINYLNRPAPVAAQAASGVTAAVSRTNGLHDDAGLAQDLSHPLAAAALADEAWLDSLEDDRRRSLRRVTE